MASKTWIEYLKKPQLTHPIAIVGSPGLRSVGKVAIDHLVKSLGAEIFAELHSTHFPTIFYTKASYAPDPSLPGEAGVKVGSEGVELPKIQFWYTAAPQLIITEGYHADFKGQYEVAEETLALYEEFKVKRLIVLAGYGTRGKAVCCAASEAKIIEELKESYGIEPGYIGPFYGFSGLVFGLAKSRGMEAFCLFGRTEPILDDPEYPDEEAAATLLKHLEQILRLNSSKPYESHS
ncbi:MAG: PAC2 family protein [Candidatus Bathyarchaeota archaeon]